MVSHVHNITTLIFEKILDDICTAPYLERPHPPVRGKSEKRETLKSYELINVLAEPHPLRQNLNCKFILANDRSIGDKSFFVSVEAIRQNL